LGIEVVEHRLGLIVPDCYSVLIRRNTTIPVTKEEVYTTLHPEQDTVAIKVYQGESMSASENMLLGEFEISGLKPERPGELAKVTVRFDFDVNGMLKVTARDRHTGQQQDITIEATRAHLSEAEILEARGRIAEATGSTLTLSTEARVLLERAERLMDSDELDPEDREELAQLLADLERARHDGDATHLSHITEDLLDLLFDLEA
jgi:molecular chaperone DnaK (HSP70)